LAWAIYCDRNNKPRSNIGFVPHWAADLRLAEKFGAAALGIDLKKYVWWRRALILNEADGRSYDFEPKRK
jgi:hypothetical protein